LAAETTQVKAYTMSNLLAEAINCDDPERAAKMIRDALGLTGKLAPVGKHVAAGEVDAYALKAALLAHRPQLRSSFG
jgi:hypothetical protein